MGADSSRKSKLKECPRRDSKPSGAAISQRKSRGKTRPLTRDSAPVGPRGPKRGDAAERSFWRSYLALWIHDALGLVSASHTSPEVVTAEARRRMRSRDRGVGSWRWVCELFDVDAEWLAELVTATGPGFALEVGRRKVDIRSTKELAA